MGRPLVIYHSGCRDGWCAAWVCRTALRTSGQYPYFHEGVYGQPPPPVAGRDVVMVDFSYPREVMEQIADEAASLVVLDHHRTARAALDGFGDGRGNVRVTFDMNRSGAGLAWDHYRPGQPRPWLVDYVEDRDLWRHALPDGPAINAYIGTLPFEFEAWDTEHAIGSARGAAVSGRVVEAKIHQYIKEVRKNAERTEFEGWDVPIVNAPQVDISELVGFMANGETLAMGWWRGNGVFNYSLRTKREDIDVSALAKLYGGGGHRAAAGFQSPKLFPWKAIA